MAERSAKRAAPSGDGDGGGGGKRSKKEWRKAAGLKKGGAGGGISDGMRGWLLTCHTHRARAAAGEAFELLRHWCAPAPRRPWQWPASSPPTALSPAFPR